ncbi:MAG: hypothetical protein LJE65_17320 [Desulfobacteraceae bacterium]|nr:hypothetical protein [Desulfobacteraceae bacterium]
MLLLQVDLAQFVFAFDGGQLLEVVQVKSTGRSPIFTSLRPGWIIMSSIPSTPSSAVSFRVRRRKKALMRARL